MRFLENSPIAYTKTITVNGNNTVDRRQTTPVRIAAQSGGFAIRHVKVLPSIPSSGFDWVIWDSDATADGGTGDDQVWTATAGMGAWAPMQKWTDLSGAVV